MHAEEVVITLYDALRGEKQYVFHEPERCVLGRADDCDIRLPSDNQHLEISRHHCLLEIDPPRVYLTDLGSTNGTYINGTRVSQGRDADCRSPITRVRMATNPIKRQLRDGDQIHLGKAALWLFVEIRAPELQTA